MQPRQRLLLPPALGRDLLPSSWARMSSMLLPHAVLYESNQSWKPPPAKGRPPGCSGVKCVRTAAAAAAARQGRLGCQGRRRLSGARHRLPRTPHWIHTCWVAKWRPIRAAKLPNPAGRLQQAGCRCHRPANNTTRVDGRLLQRFPAAQDELAVSDHFSSRESGASNIVSSLDRECHLRHAGFTIEKAASELAVPAAP